MVLGGVLQHAIQCWEINVSFFAQHSIIHKNQILQVVSTGSNLVPLSRLTWFFSWPNLDKIVLLLAKLRKQKLNLESKLLRQKSLRNPKENDRDSRSPCQQRSYNFLLCQRIIQCANIPHLCRRHTGRQLKGYVPNSNCQSRNELLRRMTHTHKHTHLGAVPAQTRKELRRDTLLLRHLTKRSSASLLSLDSGVAKSTSCLQM